MCCFFIIVRHVKKIVSLCFSLTDERHPMKNILCLFLMITQISLVAGEQQSSVEIALTHPEKLLAEMDSAIGCSNIEKGSACLALSQILARVDSAWLPDEIQRCLGKSRIKQPVSIVLS